MPDDGLMKGMKGRTLEPHEIKDEKAAGELSRLFEDNISNRSHHRHFL